MRRVWTAVLLAACGSSSTEERDDVDAAVFVPSTPPALYSVGGAYDAARGRLVTFGGFDRGQYSSETWEWDGGWTRVARTGPSGRNGPALAYDTRRGRVVMMGGTAARGARRASPARRRGSSTAPPTIRRGA